MYKLLFYPLYFPFPVCSLFAFVELGFVQILRNTKLLMWQFLSYVLCGNFLVSRLFFTLEPSDLSGSVRI